MAKLSVFNFISLDGYYKDAAQGISWHKHSPEGSEESNFTNKAAQSDSILLFGRVTYEMMHSYWPSPMALQNDPMMAKRMNSSEKIVFSKTMKKADWEHTRVVSDLVEEVKRLKKTSPKDLTLLGSGSILTQLAEAGLIDEYQLMLDPVAIGAGTSIFKGLKKPLELKLVSSQAFDRGVMLLVYQPNKK